MSHFIGNKKKKTFLILYNIIFFGFGKDKLFLWLCTYCVHRISVSEVGSSVGLEYGLRRRWLADVGLGLSFRLRLWFWGWTFLLGTSLSSSVVVLWNHK